MQNNLIEGPHKISKKVLSLLRKISTVCFITRKKVKKSKKY